MRTEEINDHIVEQAEYREQRRQIRMLAELIAHRLHVAQGRQLVLAIGHGTEHSNVEAIASWIENRAVSPKELTEMGENPGDYLTERLSSELAERMEG